MPTPLDAVQIDLAPLAGFSLDLDQYMDLWAIEETRFAGILRAVANMDLAAHVRTQQAAGADSTRSGSSTAKAADTRVALIDIQGTLTKRGSSLSAAGSMIDLRRRVRLAAADESIHAILLRIDSPGGTVAGTADLARAVREAAAVKPVIGFIEDLCASAAYYIGSQCTRLVANDVGAIVGSIGTAMALYDYSGHAGQKGIKAIVIRSSPLKGAGFPGEEITGEQKAVWQELIDQAQVTFSAAIQAGRKLTTEQVEAVAIGRVWTAGEAIKLGLIDAVETFEQTLANLTARLERSSTGRTPHSSSTRRRAMSTADAANEPQAATTADIRLACPEASDRFILGQVERGATMPQVQTAWTVELTKQLATSRQAEAKAKAAAAAAKQKADTATEAAKPKPGASMLGQGGSNASQADGQADGDPEGDFDAAVRERMGQGSTRKAAVKAVSRSNPELHQAYLLATNSPRLVGLIGDRFAD